jgi:hypothetical protein
MIAEFSFKNFLSIRTEQCLSFEATSDDFKEDEYCVKMKNGTRLLKIAMIYGTNASGKTNVLAAMSTFRDLMLDAPKDKSQEIRITPFLFDDISSKEKIEFRMIFYIEEERYVLTLSLDKKRIYSESLIYYPSIQPAKLYERTYDEKTDSSDISFGSKLNLNKKNKQAITGNTINNCSVMAAFGKANVEYSKLNLVYDFLSKEIVDILEPRTSLLSYIKQQLDKKDDGGLKDFIVNFLKASDFNICNIELREEELIITPEMEELIQISPMPKEAKKEMIQKGVITNTELLFKHRTENGEYELSEDFESHGTLRFMGLAAILRLLLQKKKIICVDEIESSLHFELLSYFIKVFLANDDKGSQLIMSTHDINLLNEEFIRRDAVWFTDKNSQGETLLTRLSTLGLHKNLSPYHAYKQGKLVQLPFLGSVYLNDENLCEAQ